MGIWSLGCGFAPNEIALDVMRGLQGLGPAATIPACLGILAHSFELGSTLRTIAFATFSSGAPMGAALGNVTTSTLTQFTKFVSSLSNVFAPAYVSTTILSRIQARVEIRVLFPSRAGRPHIHLGGPHYGPRHASP